VAAGEAGLADHDRDEQRAQPAEREDETEVSRVAAQLVADQEGQQHLEGAEEKEQRDERPAERSPEPNVLTHKAESLGDVAAHRRRLTAGLGGRRARVEERKHRDREPEGRGVDQEGGANAKQMDDEAADCRADEHEGKLSDELRERVGLDELVARDEVGDDGARRRPLERLTRAEDRRDREQMPELDAAGHGEEAERRDAGAA
jgi:hypothetical protein